MSDINSIDNFFYYGQNTLTNELRHDIVQGVMQPKNTLFYGREFGAGASDFENYPNALFLQVVLRFAIVDFIARRNQFVSDGTNGTPDRRVAVSQNSIRIEQNPDGTVNVDILYIPYADYENPDIIQIPLGITI